MSSTAVRLVGIVLAASVTVGIGGSALADTTVDFEQYQAGTVLTNQYADSGGAGQGVVFGPLPAGAPAGGLSPVIRTPPAGQAQSGSNVADFATCVGCEFFLPRTTGTFAAPRSSVSAYVGYLGDPDTCTPADPTAVACAVVSLRAFGQSGNQVAESSVTVTRGAGVHSRLAVSVPTATIVGFEISGRPGIDVTKQLAIDDLTMGKPPPPAPPDFTLNPAATNLTVQQGASVTGAIAIGRLNGSSGGISFQTQGLPTGVTATFAPNPAPGSQTVVTFTADGNAPAAGKAVSITGTPQSAAAGPAPRTFTLNLAVQKACPVVGTARELVDKLAKGHECIFVRNTAEIDLATDLAGVSVPDRLTTENAILFLPDGVTLMSGRSGDEPGGVLTLSQQTDKPNMLSLGSNTNLVGLRLRGYDQRDRKDRKDPTTAVYINESAGVTIENNELFGWPRAGVFVASSPADREQTPRITRNFIHNNVQCNRGYGVVVYGNGFVRIDRNVFNYNRHDVAGHGDPGEGYSAELNFHLTSGPKCDPGDLFQHYNQHYDMHGLKGGTGGTAGSFMEIRRNTIRGAQSYYQINRRPAFWLRGTPLEKAIFADNAVHHGSKMGDRGAVRVSGVPATAQQNAYLTLMRLGKLIISGNRQCVDTANELAVGDFDGDGGDDVFQALGTHWVYSPFGHREWHFLNVSSLRLGRLGFGDFDGDGKTDVFSQQRGARWYVSYGGTSQWKQLPAGSNIDVKRFRFGDFDGDRKTDVFRANGSRWFYSSAGATQWQPLAASRLSVNDLRLGDFDGDGKTDMFSLVNNQWSVSYGANTKWSRLNRKLSSKLGSLAFADFDGDRKTDVARTNGGKWEVSSGGATPWRTLQLRRSEPLSVGMLFGDFNDDDRADVLQHGARSPVASTACWAARNGSALFSSFERFKLSSAGSSPLKAWSVANMR